MKRNVRIIVDDYPDDDDRAGTSEIAIDVNDNCHGTHRSLIAELFDLVNDYIDKRENPLVTQKDSVCHETVNLEGPLTIAAKKRFSPMRTKRGDRLLWLRDNRDAAPNISSDFPLQGMLECGELVEWTEDGLSRYLGSQKAHRLVEALPHASSEHEIIPSSSFIRVVCGLPEGWEIKITASDVRTSVSLVSPDGKTVDTGNPDEQFMEAVSRLVDVAKKLQMLAEHNEATK